MNKIIHGDALDKLKTLKDESVQMCVTSPPYWGLRDYGHEMQLGAEATPEAFVKNLVMIFKEVKRVLKKDGTLWLNLGDSYYNYRPGSGQKLVKQTVSKTDQDLPQQCSRRGERLEGLKEKDLLGMPWRVAFALQADGWYLRQDIIWSKPNPMPESVQDRCTKSHEYIFLLSKSQNYFYDSKAIQEPSEWNPSKSKTPDGWDTGKGSHGSFHKDGREKGQVYKNSDTASTGANKRSVWTINTKPFKAAHFAVFPPELPELCIKAGSKEGDTVLDPFFGSGTTGLVAKKGGRKYLGIELNEDYIKIAENRLSQSVIDFK